MAIDVLERGDLPFPRSLPEFQRLFPDEAACAAYLERARWINGFICPRCGTFGEPYRISTRPGVLRCRKCRCDTSLTAGTVMERTHTPLAVQFQRQLGLSCYETTFQILHKLRVGMVRPDQDRIGGKPGEHVEADESYVGGRTRWEGRSMHHKSIVAAAVEVRQRESDSALSTRRNSCYTGRVRLAVVPDRGTDALCGFVKSVVAPGARIITDDWSGYAGLSEHGYDHVSVAERGDPQVAEEYAPIIHLVFSNLKTWLRDIHHGVSPQHLQAYFNEFTFRFSRRFYPFNAFLSLLGIAGDVAAPTYAELYAAKSRHPTSSGCV